VINVRAAPWLIALAGLAILAAAGGAAVWPLIAVWLAVLALVWSFGRAGLALNRRQQVALAAGLLPVLFLLTFEGGLFLVPADIAWLAIEVAARPSAMGASTRSSHS
jgi:hypothetical protein